MAEKKLGRVIGVRFPNDHIIWTYPEGQRANQIRELVDLALVGRVNIPYMKVFTKELEDVAEQLKVIREAIARLEERLDTRRYHQKSRNRRLRSLSIQRRSWTFNRKGGAKPK